MTTFSLVVMLDVSKYAGSVVATDATPPNPPIMLTAEVLAMRVCAPEYSMLPPKLLLLLIRLALLEEKLRVVDLRRLAAVVMVKLGGCRVDVVESLRSEANCG